MIFIVLGEFKKSLNLNILHEIWGETRKMEGFDDAAVFFSDNFNPDEQNGNQINLQAVKKRFKEFIRTFNEDNFHYKYR